MNLGFSLLPLVQNKMQPGPKYDEYKGYAFLMMTTCVIPVMLTTSLSTIITNSCMTWLLGRGIQATPKEHDKLPDDSNAANDHFHKHIVGEHDFFTERPELEHGYHK